MKTLYAIAITLLLATVNTFAQNEQERADIAKNYLDKMSSKNKSYTTIKATFTVTIDNKQANSKIDQKGSLSVKGNKYKLDMLNSITFFDGTSVCTWLTEEKEANITDVEEGSEAALGPMQLLGSYESGYKMRYMQDVKVGAANCVEVDLYPTNHKNNITRIRLTIDKTSYTIKRLMQQGKDGTTYYVNIDSFTTNTNIADSEFKFDPKAHPDVEVVDLR